MEYKPEPGEQPLNSETMKIDAYNLSLSKVMNVTVTINKVNRVLQLMDTDEPPIRRMTNKEIVDNLWISKNCLREDLEEILDFIETDNDFNRE